MIWVYFFFISYTAPQLGQVIQLEVSSFLISSDSGTFNASDIF